MFSRTISHRKHILHCALHQPIALSKSHKALEISHSRTRMALVSSLVCMLRKYLATNISLLKIAGLEECSVCMEFCRRGEQSSLTWCLNRCLGLWFFSPCCIVYWGSLWRQTFCRLCDKLRTSTQACTCCWQNKVTWKDWNEVRCGDTRTAKSWETR